MYIIMEILNWLEVLNTKKSYILLINFPIPHSIYVIISFNFIMFLFSLRQDGKAPITDDDDKGERSEDSENTG